MRADKQYCLDFGQKNIDAIRCQTCGMLYVVGEESDEKAHAKFHADFDDGVKWSVKLERPKKYYEDRSRVVAINSNDPKATIDIVNKLLKLSDGDMSAGEDASKYLNRKNTMFLLYITPTNRVVGYIIVETIEEANELVDYNSSRIESESVPAMLGVMYLWVHPFYRRRQIATKLLDVSRANLKQEFIIRRSQIAVCEPTELSIPFLNSYLKKRTKKVYRH